MAAEYPRGTVLCQVSYLALAAAMLLWYGAWFPSRAALLVLVPLLAVGALMLFTASRGRLLYAGMVCFLLFIHGVTEAMVLPRERLPALLATALSLLYFAGLWSGIRQQRAARRAAASQAPPAT